jgi:hypothetical protein
VRLRGGTSHPAAALARGRQPLRFTAGPARRPSDLLPGPPACAQTAARTANAATGDLEASACPDHATALRNTLAAQMRIPLTLVILTLWRC